LKRLKPGEIFVCEVIGTCSRVEAEKRGIAFAPEKSGYAGKENPVGIRFQGLVHWGTQVIKKMAG
jgi:hypothetical protein